MYRARSQILGRNIRLRRVNHLNKWRPGHAYPYRDFLCVDLARTYILDSAQANPSYRNLAIALPVVPAISVITVMEIAKTLFPVLPFGAAKRAIAEEQKFPAN